jgi:hypothetical protein
MKSNEDKVKEHQQFNPRIIVGIVGSIDLNALQTLKDFFETLNGFSLIYLRTSGSPLYISDKKPERERCDK